MHDSLECIALYVNDKPVLVALNWFYTCTKRKKYVVFSGMFPMLFILLRTPLAGLSGSTLAFSPVCIRMKEKSLIV